MNVNFRTILGKTYKIALQPNQTLADAKQILSSQEDISLEKAQFIYRAEILQENIPISNFQIKEDRYIVIHNSFPKKVSAIQPPPSENIPTSHNFDKAESISLPPQPQIDDIVDESNEFNRFAKTLVDMGFTREQAIQALRATKNNLDSAISLLVSENAPIPEELLSMNRSPPQQPQSNIDQPASEQNHGRYNVLQDQYDLLTSEEKAALERLEALGFDPTTTIQIYVVCGKDEESARNCLSSLR